ncbi:MAG: BolA family transcriptional regulator [Gammaproteobacteria bacterium]|nr:BolA family transcriptional regulator [Gammaproteobacteria bacterium]
MTPQERIDYIRQRLSDAFSPSQLEIGDDSHLHAGHASAKGGGHFRVMLVSDAFRGKPTIQRHRMVYAAMGEAMNTEIHALSIRALSSDEI